MLDQRKRLLIAILRGFASRGCEIRLRRTRILGPIQMLGMETEIPLRKPRCGPLVQLSLSRPEQSCVDGVPDKGMAKQKIISLRPQQGMFYRPPGSIKRVLDQGGQPAKLKALPEHGC